MLARIKADYLTARKTRDIVMVKLLSTFISDAEMIGKNDGGREVTDSEVIALLKKYIKNLNETLDVVEDESVLLERAMLETYLPTQLTDEDLRSIVRIQIELEGYDSPKQMGLIMKFLKETYDGQFDGKTASQIAREMLS